MASRPSDVDPGRPRSGNDAARCTCGICGASFSRTEHLARHRKSHTREKPFGCPVCGKSFARQDVMSRHVTTHEAQSNDRSQAGAPTRIRACRRCAACRVRCSRTEPCTRCTERSLICVYPPGEILTRTPSRSETVNNHGSSLTALLGVQGSQVAGTQGFNSGGGSEIGPQQQAGIPDVASVSTEGVSLSRSEGCANILGLDQTSAQVNQLASFNGPAMFDQPPFYGAFAQGNHVNEQIADVLAMNWISPQYSQQLDWIDMLAPESLAQPDTSSAPFSFLFDVPRGVDAVELLSPVEPREQLESYATQTDLGSSFSGTARRGSDAPASYVDGGEARAPFPATAFQRHQERGSEGGLGLGMTLNTPMTVITHAAYNKMIQRIQCEIPQQHPGLDIARLPSYERTAHLAALYFTNFHPVFPFISRTTFRSESSRNWVLLLAVAVIGAKYANPRGQGFHSDGFLAEMLDLVLRTRLHVTQDHNHGREPWNLMLHEPDRDSLALSTLQATILNIIQKLHCGNKALVRGALAERHHLVTECHRLALLTSATDSTPTNLDYGANLSAWVERQSRLRTGMMIWLLDFTTAYEYNTPALMQLVDATGPLPCPEHIWNAPSAESIRSVEHGSVSLLEAVEMLYIEKRLPDNLTEFGGVLLVHAILRRTREAFKQAQSQLSSWIPTAAAQPRAPQRGKDSETWPPATPLLSRWRNSACDCLDILHWRANAKAAGSAGWEHPTIFYLHAARLVLLAPTAHLHTLAVLAGDPAAMSNPKYLEARALVLRWAIHDCFKARLSVIHAGAVFWHVRRYARGSFAEPFAVYMATLVLWAYGIAAQSAKQHGQQQQQNQQQSQSQSRPVPAAADAARRGDNDGERGQVDNDNDTDDLFFIHLDRPCDDEMVQTYIRRGGQIPAYMARVGSITDEGAAAKIAREGIRLLSAAASCSTGGGEDDEPGSAASADGQQQQQQRQLNGSTRRPPAAARWGIEVSFVGILEALVRVMEGQRTVRRGGA